MVIANAADGTTTRYDLSDRGQLQSLTRLINAHQVTVLSLYVGGVQHTLQTPRRFRQRPTYRVDLLTARDGSAVGERISVQAGEVRVSLSTTYSSKLVRCDLVRTGRMAYNPT